MSPKENPITNFTRRYIETGAELEDRKIQELTEIDTREG